MIDRDLVISLYESGCSIRDICTQTGAHRGEVRSVVFEINERSRWICKMAPKKESSLKKKPKVKFKKHSTELELKRRRDREQEKYERKRLKRIEFDGERESLPVLKSPKCATPKQIEAWLEVSNKVKQFCRDCTPEYQAEMISQHRCDCPQSVFVWRHIYQVSDPTAYPVGSKELIGLHPTEVLDRDEWAVRGDPDNLKGYRL